MNGAAGKVKSDFFSGEFEARRTEFKKNEKTRGKLTFNQHSLGHFHNSLLRYRLCNPRDKIQGSIDARVIFFC